MKKLVRWKGIRHERKSESAQVYVTSKLTEQKYDLDRIVFDPDAQMDLLSSHADDDDYLTAIGSGLICGILDAVWGGAFDLRRNREWSSSQTEWYAVKMAQLTGFQGEEAVRFLEKRFCIPSDKNTPDFGGGLQHHLRDFAHHPTVVGLVFSLLTQFTQRAYGTDTSGAFVMVPVPKEALGLIGKNIPEKLFNGVVVWFFHLVSDIVGFSSTAGKTGGTGIPGPLLAMAKEMAALPVFQDKDGKNQRSVFLSKLFGGTLLAEAARQAPPVVANECMVRAFYMIRRLSATIQERKVDSWQSLKRRDWQNILPIHSPTLTQMLTVATGVFYHGGLRRGADRAEEVVGLRQLCRDRSVRCGHRTGCCGGSAGTGSSAIAVLLVGSNFAGLSGAALTSACLAYLGGGAVLGLGAGSAVGGGMTALSRAGKKNTILQSAKLMVSVEEIFLNGEKDLAYSPVCMSSM